MNVERTMEALLTQIEAENLLEKKNLFSTFSELIKKEDILMFFKIILEGLKDTPYHKPLTISKLEYLSCSQNDNIANVRYQMALNKTIIPNAEILTIIYTEINILEQTEKHSELNDEEYYYKGLLLRLLGLINSQDGKNMKIALDIYTRALECFGKVGQKKSRTFLKNFYTDLATLCGDISDTLIFIPNSLKKRLLYEVKCITYLKKSKLYGIKEFYKERVYFNRYVNTCLRMKKFARCEKEILAHLFRMNLLRIKKTANNFILGIKGLHVDDVLVSEIYAHLLLGAVYVPMKKYKLAVKHLMVGLDISQNALLYHVKNNVKGKIGCVSDKKNTYDFCNDNIGKKFDGPIVLPVGKIEVEFVHTLKISFLYEFVRLYYRKKQADLFDVYYKQCLECVMASKHLSHRCNIGFSMKSRFRSLNFMHGKRLLWKKKIKKIQNAGNGKGKVVYVKKTPDTNIVVDNKNGLLFVKEKHKIVRIVKGDDLRVKYKKSLKKRRIRRKCVSCKGRGRYVCGHCRITFYCSRRCQAIDWKSGHRNMCSKSLPKKSVQNGFKEFYEKHLKDMQNMILKKKKKYLALIEKKKKKIKKKKSSESVDIEKLTDVNVGKGPKGNVEVPKGNVEVPKGREEGPKGNEEVNNKGKVGEEDLDGNKEKDDEKEKKLQIFKYPCVQKRTEIVENEVVLKSSVDDVKKKK